jgi:hypothetical protein
MVELADKMIADSVEWYRLKALSLERLMIGNLIDANEAAFIVAYKLASKDMHRMTVDNEGSIIVWNRRMW